MAHTDSAALPRKTKDSLKKYAVLQKKRHNISCRKNASVLASACFATQGRIQSVSKEEMTELETLKANTRLS